MGASFLKKFLAAFFVLSFFLLLIFVYSPAKVYYQNTGEFSFFFRSILSQTAVIVFALSCILSLLIAALPCKTHKIFIISIFSFSFLLWLQGFVFLWPYGELEAELIPWKKMYGYGFVDGLLWIVFFVYTFKKSKKIYSMSKYVCIFLIITQTMVLMYSMSKEHEYPANSAKKYHIDGTEAFYFSKKQNVFFIILDAYQGDLFEAVLAADEGLEKSFEGFTYYPDTLASYSKTYFAVPSIFSGKMYDNSHPRLDYLEESYTRGSFLSDLAKNGFTNHIFPTRVGGGSFLKDHRLAANIHPPEGLRNKKIEDFSRLIRVVLFSHAPHFLKQFIYNEGHWAFPELPKHLENALIKLRLLESAERSAPKKIYDYKKQLDEDFIEFCFGSKESVNYLENEYIPEVSFYDSKPLFKYYHLHGPHIPMEYTRDFEKVERDFSRSHYIEQALAYTRLMAKFIKILKHYGIYDNSLIIISGDHGSGRTEDVYIRPTMAEKTKRLSRTTRTKDFQHDKARGVPLLLVKSFGSKGPLKKSLVPAAHVDIRPTILSELKIRYDQVRALSFTDDFYGVPLGQLDETEHRPRYYASFRSKIGGVEYIPSLTLYKVEGFSWDDASWDFEKRLRPPKA